MNNTETSNTEGWNRLNADDTFSKRYKNDPEFRAQFENKRRKMRYITCFIRIFCCPCI